MSWSDKKQPVNNNGIFDGLIFRWKVGGALSKYSHLSNNFGGWNKRGGGAKVAKLINMEDRILWKKLVDNCNKRGVEKKKNLKDL